MKAIKALFSLLLIGTLSLCFFGCSEDDDYERDERCDHDWSDWELVKDGYCHEREWERECDECGEKRTKSGKNRDHEQAPKKTFDENYHWYPCRNCDFRFEQEAHILEDGECINCSYYTDPMPGNPLAGTYYVTLWVSERENGENSVVKQMQAQIDAFEAANPGIVINATISGVTEADAGSQVVADIATAPDIFCFAQDQLASLVGVNALAAPYSEIAAEIRANNDSSSVLAATFDGTVYAYPMTSDNGYYLYYDKSIISDPTSLEAIIADCERAYYSDNNNYLFRYALENGWYTASFFFGAGCHSKWITNENGRFVDIDDNFNSTQGLIAMKGMQKLAQSVVYDSNADWFNNTAAIVTGIWNAQMAEEHFGENLGVCKLPTFTVDGNTYQLGSFSGNKLMGVKPQTDAKKGAVLQLLAHYLTSEKCQLERYEAFYFGPSNLAAQSSEAVASDPHLAALAAQNAHAVPQGQIHGGWWDLVNILGHESGVAEDEADLIVALENYEKSIEGLKPITEEERMTWSVIGNANGTCWDTDFPMIQISEGVWESEPLYFSAGSEFKLRRGASWDVQVGADGQMMTPYIDPPNIIVETTGTYVIQFCWDGVSDKAQVFMYNVD